MVITKDNYKGYIELYKHRILPIEEIKETYFEETRYDGYTINHEIQQEELEKTKVKKIN